MKKAVARNEQFAGAKVNFDKSDVLQLGYWRDGVSQPGPFCWSYRPICILEVYFLGHHQGRIYYKSDVTFVYTFITPPGSNPRSRHQI